MSSDFSLHVLPVNEEAAAASEQYLEEHPELEGIDLAAAGIKLETMHEAGVRTVHDQLQVRSCR